MHKEYVFYCKIVWTIFESSKDECILESIRENERKKKTNNNVGTVRVTSWLPSMYRSLYGKLIVRMCLFQTGIRSVTNEKKTIEIIEHVF